MDTNNLLLIAGAVLGFLLLRSNPNFFNQFLGSRRSTPDAQADPEPVEVNALLASRPGLKLLLDALAVAAAISPNKVDDILVKLAQQVIGETKKE